MYICLCLSWNNAGKITQETSKMKKGEEGEVSGAEKEGMVFDVYLLVLFWFVSQVNIQKLFNVQEYYPAVKKKRRRKSDPLGQSG